VSCGLPQAAQVRRWPRLAPEDDPALLPARADPRRGRSQGPSSVPCAMVRLHWQRCRPPRRRRPSATGVAERLGASAGPPRPQPGARVRGKRRRWRRAGRAAACPGAGRPRQQRPKGRPWQVPLGTVPCRRGRSRQHAPPAAGSV